MKQWHNEPQMKWGCKEWRDSNYQAYCKENDIHPICWSSYNEYKTVRNKKITVKNTIYVALMIVIVLIIFSPLILGPEIIIDGLLEFSTRLFILYTIIWLSTGICGGLICITLLEAMEAKIK